MKTIAVILCLIPAVVLADDPIKVNIPGIDTHDLKAIEAAFSIDEDGDVSIPGTLSVSNGKTFHTTYDIPEYIVDYISGMRGVSYVSHLDRYELNIYKGERFEWPDLSWHIRHVIDLKGEAWI